MLATKQRMSEKEKQRREITGKLSSDTILNAMNSLVLNESATICHPSEILGVSGEMKEFSIELTSPYFIAPKTIRIKMSDNNEKGK